MLTILTGDAIEQLRTLPDESVQCCVTSPPYWGLRDYGTAKWEGGDDRCDHLDPKATQRNDTATMYGADSQHLSLKPFNGDCGKCGAKRIDSQLGLEKTPEEYVAKMLEVFREVRRVLRKDGTLWLNLGDSYAQSGGKQEPEPLEVLQERAHRRGYDVGGWGAKTKDGQGIAGRAANTAVSGLKPKDLCGIPWRVAFALQADGWWLRSDIIWAKPNPMPESVTDRPTKAHEYLFLLTKASTYFYDAEAIKEKANPDYASRYDYEFNVGAKEFNGADRPDGAANTPGLKEFTGSRNKRSVWTVATAPYPEAHFATYPPDLIKPCIMAGTSAKGCCAKCWAPWERVVERGLTAHDGTTNSAYPKGTNANTLAMLRQAARERGEEYNGQKKTLGWQPTCECREITEREYLYFDPVPCTVLDPFAGSGTTGAVALELGRKAVLIELNPKYVKLIRQRCDITPGLQLA